MEIDVTVPDNIVKKTKKNKRKSKHAKESCQLFAKSLQSCNAAIKKSSRSMAMSNGPKLLTMGDVTELLLEKHRNKEGEETETLSDNVKSEKDDSESQCSDELSDSGFSEDFFSDDEDGEITIQVPVLEQKKYKERQTGSKYDQLKPWHLVKKHITAVLDTEEESQENITISTGLQFIECLPHQHELHVVEYIRTKQGTTFVTQINTGATSQLYIWNVYGTGENKQVKCKKITLKEEFQQLIFIPKFRIFAAYCSDMRLALFTDHTVGFKQFCSVLCTQPVLSLAFNPDRNELLAGAYGCVLRWDIHEYYREKIYPLPALDLEIGLDEDVICVEVNTKLKNLNIVLRTKSFVWDYEHDRKLSCYRNNHPASLTNTVFHYGLDYVITSYVDGQIKVFSKSGFLQMYIFSGQYEEITSLFIHPHEPLLFSSSLDGTIRIYRLDTFEEFQCIPVGEAILGMRLLNSHELFYWTQQNIYIYQINLQHRLFNATQSGVLSLQKCDFAGYPGRVLVATEDGSIRIICPMSGEEICIVYPLPFLQGIQYLIMDRPEDKLYSLYHGEVLVFDCTTNPCQPAFRIRPEYHESPISCIGSISACSSLEDQAEQLEESIVFVGHEDGMISLLKANHVQMSRSVRAHEGQVTILEHSVLGRSDRQRTAIAARHRLLSGGLDRCVRVWGLVRGKLPGEVTLCQLQKVKMDNVPSHIAMIGSSLCYSVVNLGHVSIVRCGDRPGDVHFLFHIGDENHVKPVNGMSGLSSLNLFVTSGADNVVKLWSVQGHLVREIVFQGSVQRVCFGTERGDLLLGYNHHIFSVSIEEYLPTDILSQIISQDFQDELMEEPLPFDHDLQLWFEYDDLPVYPLNPGQRSLQLEQDLQLTHVLQLYNEIRRKESEARIEKYQDYHTQVIKSHIFLKRLSSYKSSLAISPVTSPQQHGSIRKLTDPVRSSNNRLLPLPYRPASLSPDSSLFDGGDSAVFVWNNSQEEMSKSTSGAAGRRRSSVQIQASKSKSRRGSLYIKPPDPAPVKSAQELEDERLQQITEDRRKTELDRIWREEQRKKYPVAPDGYIPNSVVRGVMNFRPPSPPAIVRPFKLKPVPSALPVESSVILQSWSESTVTTARSNRKRGAKPLTMAEEMAMRRRASIALDTGQSFVSSTSGYRPSIGREGSLDEVSLPPDLLEEEEVELGLDPISEMAMSRQFSGRYAPSPMKSEASVLSTIETPVTMPDSASSVRRFLGSPRKNVPKPSSGSCRSCSATKSIRELSDLDSKPMSGTRLTGSGHVKRSRGLVPNQLLDVRPLTRGSSNVMEILPEGVLLTQGSISLTQGSRPLTQERKAFSPRNKREQQVAKIMGRAKAVKVEVTTINLDKEALPTKRKSKERPFAPSRQGTNMSSAICETPWEEEEEEPEEEEDEEIESRDPSIQVLDSVKSASTQEIHPLLKQIMAEAWYPGGFRDPSVHGVSRGLNHVIDQMDNATHKVICDYILKIHREVGFPKEVFESVVEKLTSQLQSSNAVKRGNAVKTLRELGVDTKAVLKELLPLLLDSEQDLDKMSEEERQAAHAVKDEVTAALSTLAKVENKDDLADLLEKMGMVAHKIDPKHEEEALRSLEKKHSGPHTQGPRDIPGVPAEKLTPDEMVDRLQLWMDNINSQDTEEAKEGTTDDKQTSGERSKTKKKKAVGKTKKRHTLTPRKERTDSPSSRKTPTTPEAGGSDTPRSPGTPRSSSETPRTAVSPRRSETPDRKAVRAEGEAGWRLSAGAQVRKPDSSGVNQPDPVELSTYEIPGSDQGLQPAAQPQFGRGQDRVTAGSHLQGLPGGMTATGLSAPAGSSQQQTTGGGPAVGLGGASLGPSGLGGASLGLVGLGVPPLPHTGADYMQGFADGNKGPGPPPNTGTGREDHEGQTPEEGQVDDPSAQGYGKAKPRRRGNYTYFEWRGRSPRSQGMEPDPTASNRQQLPTITRNNQFSPDEGGGVDLGGDSLGGGQALGVELPCSYCGNAVQVLDDGGNQGPGHASQFTHGGVGVDYQLYEKSYKYRRSNIGAIREWDNLEGSDNDSLQPLGVSPNDTMTSLAASPYDMPGFDGVTPGGDLVTPGGDLSSLKVKEGNVDSALGTELDELSSMQHSSRVPEEADSGVGDDNATRSRAQSLVSKGQPGLSTVRSTSDMSYDREKGVSTPPDNWREFFDLPEAQTRRKMEEKKKKWELEQNRPLSLPPIEYIKDDIVIPGDPGIRLLHRVNVNKGREPPLVDGNRQKHRVDAVPGKLSTTTTLDEYGSSNYGILNMAWTTGSQPTPRRQQGRGPDTDHIQHSVIYSESRGASGASSAFLPSLGAGPRQRAASTDPQVPGYEWETPLPPPPDRQLTLDDPQVRKGHEHYCDYYRLLKKRLHDHVSSRGPLQSLASSLLSRQRTRLLQNLSRQTSAVRPPTMATHTTGATLRLPSLHHNAVHHGSSKVKLRRSNTGGSRSDLESRRSMNKIVINKEDNLNNEDVLNGSMRGRHLASQDTIMNTGPIIDAGDLTLRNVLQAS